MVCKRVIRALHTTERESHNHNLFDFGTQLRFLGVFILCAKKIHFMGCVDTNTNMIDFII
jgi:hypothetical protein